MRRVRRFVQARDPEAIRIAGAVLILSFVFWLLIWRTPATFARRECTRLYAAAATAEDTLLIDRQAVGAGTRAGAWNCGMLRRAGPHPPDSASRPRGG